MEAETLTLAQGIDFSLWGLFARATLTVKFVVIVLLLSSSWRGGTSAPKIVS